MIRRTRRRWCGAIALVASACFGPAAASELSPNTLTECESFAGWKLLFDGSSFDGWRKSAQKGESDGWQAVDGVLTCDGGGSIGTSDEYHDFELSAEFQVLPPADRPFALASAEDAEEAAPKIRSEGDVDPLRLGSIHRRYVSDFGAVQPSGAWIALASSPGKAAAALPNTLTAAEQAAGWKPLFDGETLDRPATWPTGESEEDEEHAALARFEVAEEVEATSGPRLRIQALDRRDPLSLGARLSIFEPAAAWNHVHIQRTRGATVVHVDGVLLYTFDERFADRDQIASGEIRITTPDLFGQEWGVVGFQCSSDQVAFRNVKIKPDAEAAAKSYSNETQVFNFFISTAR